MADTGHARHDDSPLSCRCYFVNGERITTDCQVGHNKQWTAEQASELGMTYLAAPPPAAQSAGLRALHALAMIADGTDDNAATTSRFARRILNQIETEMLQ